MDATMLDELETQHRQVEELFSRLSRADDEAAQRPLVAELTEMLLQHMQIEESEIYPEVMNLDSELEEEAQIEHELGREALARLDEMIGRPGFGAVVDMLEAAIHHHVEEEEEEVFPKLREAMGYPPSDVSKRELYEQAKAAGIEGRSTMTKEQLAAALQGEDAQAVS
jgi:hemerythrin superfamily protein